MRDAEAAWRHDTPTSGARFSFVGSLGTISSRRKNVVDTHATAQELDVVGRIVDGLPLLKATLVQPCWCRLSPVGSIRSMLPLPHSASAAWRHTAGALGARFVCIDNFGIVSGQRRDVVET